jgi:hypothetical protein
MSPAFCALSESSRRLWCTKHGYSEAFRWHWQRGFEAEFQKLNFRKCTGNSTIFETL